MGYLDMKLDEERRREEGLLRDLDVVGTFVTGEEDAFQSEIAYVLAPYTRMTNTR